MGQQQKSTPSTCKATTCPYNYIAPEAHSQECIGCEHNLKNMRMPVRSMATEPATKVTCLWCDKLHEHDLVTGWGCLVLEDSTQLPVTIWGAWCDQDHFTHWLDSPRTQFLFDE